MVICPIPTYNSSPGYPRDHRLWLMWLWHTHPSKGQFIPSALLSPQARERSQPAHTNTFRLLMCHALPLLLPHRMLERSLFCSALLINRNTKLQNIIGGAVRLGKNQYSYAGGTHFPTDWGNKPYCFSWVMLHSLTQPPDVTESQTGGDENEPLGVIWPDTLKKQDLLELVLPSC